MIIWDVATIIKENLKIQNTIIIDLLKDKSNKMTQP